MVLAARAHFRRVMGSWPDTAAVATMVPVECEGIENHANGRAGAAWQAVVAGGLERAEADIRQQAGGASFTRLGGTSLRAIELSALLARRCGLTVSPRSLLGPEPLADVIRAAPPVVASTSDTDEPTDLREPSRVQQAMLFSEQLYGGSAFHLLFSADIRGPVDAGRLRSALAWLTGRHAALRTVFIRDDDGGLRRRVLAEWAPVLIEQSLPPPVDDDAVTGVHATLGPASGCLLRPYERPPVVFVLSRVDAGRAVLSLLIHHALADGWSIGLLWKELFARLERATDADVRGAAPRASTMDRLIAHERSDSVARWTRQRAGELSGLPTTVALPTDLDRPARLSRTGTRLVFGLTDAARLGCETLAARAGVTRNMVLLAAWSLVIGRRAGVSDFLLGVVSAARTADSLDVVGPCMKLLPVVCRLDDRAPVTDHVQRTAGSLRDALDATDVPFEDIVAALEAGGDDSRNPLVQVAFAAHDELVPCSLEPAGLTVTLHEGHCGGAVYDAVLYVQRWGDRPRLALEYATSALRADEAAELAGAMDRALVEMAAAAGAPLADARTMTTAQQARLASIGAGPDAPPTGGLWQLFAEVARSEPDRIAVRDSDAARALTYGQLLHAAKVQSAELARAGVGEGERVALMVRRSAREVLAILALLRLGAAYVGIERDVPPAAARAMLDLAGADVILGDAERLGVADELWGRRVLRIADPWQAAASVARMPAAAPADPSRVAYVAFTSGSTGAPKGTLVPHRGVVRLARNPGYLLPGASERFVRLAPLAFDASTLELFAPLLAGGTIDVFPGEYATPDDLAAFLAARRSTGLWLTAGLFRLVADYRPDAFQGLHQVLTGGDVVPPAQVRRVLRACPGLRLTNGYGPTENTTFTTVHHVDDPAEAEDPLPIGRPIAGTGALVLDRSGRPVPPGGVGELYTSGEGVALGYAGLPDETARAFGRFRPDSDEVLYRTGDLVRWDAAGRLRFLGRRDAQVKVRGFRIELDLVTRTLREHPAVRDAAVVAIADSNSAAGGSDRRLLAGVVAEDRAGLLDEVRSFAAERLPGYAVPSLWAVVAELPVTRNGKLDAGRVRDLALSRDPERDPPSGAGVSGDEVVQAVVRAWQQVLGRHRFGLDERFFDVGGDSLQLLRVAASLRRDMPGHDITVHDLFAHQTIRTLSGRLRAQRA